MSPQGFFKVHIVQGGDPGHLCIHSPVRASNDAVGQLDQHRQVRPHGHHQGVAAAVSTASSVAAADTAHRDTATADTADNNTATAAAADTAAASVNAAGITAAASWLPSTFPVSLSLPLYRLWRQGVHCRRTARAGPPPPLPPCPLSLPS